MSRSTTAVSGSEARLVRILDRYLAAMEEGVVPDTSALLAEHPDLAEDLEACLASLEFIRRAGVSPLAPAAGEVQGRVGSIVASDEGVLGDFRILREVGRGGMGVVYEAEQISLGRRVALKVLPFAAALDQRQLQRFKVEAQAAAQLHHTHIVPVFTVGVERGVHFYAMQFIEGKTLADLVRELRALERPDRPDEMDQQPVASVLPSPLVGEGGPQGLQILPSRLAGEGDPRGPQILPSPLAGEGGPEGRMRGSPHFQKRSSKAPSSTPAHSRAFFRAVAELGIQAAEALEYAHSLGVIHRDIKPANLLIDARGSLWVTDFGLAQFHAEPGLTITGDLVGTLRYMSPEQALGHPAVIDQRTDVYSLGVTLYELLTFRPAFPGDDRQALLRQIAEEEPMSPRRLNPAIPRELETIVLKAISKEPGSRYATAQELADDLRRYLESKPIRARRPAFVERAGKWARRNRAMVAAVSTGMVLAVIGLSIATALAATAYRREVGQRKEAQENFRLARNAVEEMLTEVGDQTLKDVPGFEPTRKKLLLKALNFYQEFLAQRSQDPTAKLDVAKAHRRMGDIRMLLGEHDEARKSFDRAIALLEAMPQSGPESAESQSELGKAHRQSGMNEFTVSHFEAAEGFFKKAITLQEKQAADHPERPECRDEWANSLNHLSVILYRLGRIAEGHDAERQGREILAGLVEAYPAVGRYRMSLGGSLNNAALLLAKQGKLAESRRLLDRAIEHTQLALDLEPGNRTARRFLRNQFENLSMILEQDGDSQGALATFRRGLPLGESLVAESPHVPEYRADLAESYHNMAILLSHQPHTNLAESESAYRRAIDLLQRLKLESPDVPRYYVSQGTTYVTLAQFLGAPKGPKEAEASCRLGLEVLQSGAARWPDNLELRRELAHGHSILGAILLGDGRVLDAASSLRRAIELWEAMSAGARADNSGHDELATAYRELATIQGGDKDPKLRNLSEALRLARRAVDVRPKGWAEWKTLGVLRYRSSDWKGATEALEQSMTLHPEGDANIWLFLAMARWRLGERDKAQSWYDKSVPWIEKNKPKDEELDRLRAEAEALLGLSDARKPVPKEMNHSK